jgi:hypothetical protein
MSIENEEFGTGTADQEQGDTRVKPPSPVGRLAVVATVYHVPQDDEPVSVQYQFDRSVRSDEQTYTRRVKIGEQWTPLDHGWVEQAGMVVVSNDEGRFLKANPTIEEKAETSLKIIEIAVVAIMTSEKNRTMHSPPRLPDVTVPFGLVYPGETTHLTPLDVKTLRLRCRSGTARVSLTVIPA